MPPQPHVHASHPTHPPSRRSTSSPLLLIGASTALPPDVTHLLDVLARIEVRRRTLTAVAKASLVPSLRKVG